MKKFRKNKKRICAGILAFVLSASPILNDIPSFFLSSEAATYGDTMQAYIKDSGFRQYCIDGMSPNNALGVADRYVYVSPYASLSEAEAGQIFFALLSLEVSQGGSQDINKALNQLNVAAASIGLTPMGRTMSKDDLKLYLHSAATRAKYPWVQAWSDNADKLLEAAGLLSSSSSGSTMGGLVPATLAGHTTPETAVAADGTLSIKFAQDGSDAGFIQSVPLKFSATGEAGSYVSEIPNGWTYVKTDTEIIFTNPGNSPTPLYVQFDPIGTRYETAMGTFASARDLYEQCLQLWVLQQCAGQHKKFPRIGVVPAQQHQRLAYVEMALPSSVYYASVGASGVFGTGIFWGQQGFGGNGGNTPSYPSGTSSSGSLEFNCYRHEEDWTSTYNTQLTKYDHETGETLEESSFRLYERFDDKDQVNLERDGAVELYGGTDHETYLSKYLDNPVVWDDYRFVATVTTNEEGYASNTVEHKYHYDKTFCDGHPAPAFVEVPEEEEDEEGEVTNQDEIDEAKEENRRLASGWLECFDACDETASAGTYEGVHFHWLMSEVSQGEISSIASSGGEEGSTPNAGPTSSASGEDSYVNSGCKQDAEATYNKFIALKYSYTYQEDTARNGYILHDLHNDDLPIEVITTDSSENGANSFFANEYSNHIQINEDAAPEADSSTSRVEQGAVHSITESEYAELTGEDLDVPELEEEKKEGILSKAISFFTKIFKIEKEVELEETKAPERVDGSAADTKKSDDEEFQEHETVDGADETTDSDDIDNKNSSDSDGEILDSTEASDKDEEDQENKGEVENPDGGMSDTDSKDESEKNDSGTGSEDVAEKDSDTGNNSGDLENSDSVDDAASKEPDSAVGDVSARLETFEGKVFSGWIEKGIQKIFGIMTVYAETTENAAGSDIEKESVSARETKDDDSEDVSDEEERRPSKEETPIQDVVKDNRDLKNEENPSKEELADIDSEEFLDDDIEDEQEFIEDEERISEIEALGGRKVDLASDSNATYVAYVEFTKQRDEGGLTVSGSDEPDISLYAQLSGSGKELFESAYSTAKGSPSVGVLITPGSADHFSHCNDEDGCGNMWRIYDHRTEGEIHINKRDLDLENGANDAYDSYGDSQGDATLEGAVYGLFAAADIIHPDGKTGTIYMANDLVAVTTTDKNGDASFMAFTEAPGMIYDCEEGKIVDRGQGWNAASPQNLYDHAETYDEYTADADVVRTYPDYKLANGNCWIGRPLILGDYYVKELTRSEGYELSIGNRMQQQTNLGQDVNAGVPGDLTGYAGIVGILAAEEQISDEPTGDVEDPDYNQLFFTAESEKTGDSGFDLVFRNLPEGVKLYRKDSISTTKEVEAGTGIYDEVPVKNIFGLPEYVVAENNHQYPKYNADGSIKTKTTNVNFTAKNVIRVTRKGLDPAKVTDVILASVPGMSDDDLLLRLASVPDVDNDFALLKIKVEQALRTNGKSSPNYKRSGVTAYSSMDELVFDRGVWEGETDTYGISGGSVGSAADKTVCGSPLVTLTINKEGTDGEAVSLSSLIVSILDYYNTHDYYNYGGVDYIKENADSWTVGLYANRTNYPMLFYVPADSSSGDAMFYRVASMPTDHSKRPRAIYVAYSEDAIYDPRGEMKNFSVNEDGTVNAILSPAVQADENGDIVNGVVTETEFYKTGETPLDKNGNKIPKVTYVERTEKISVEVNECKWTEIPLTKEGNVWIAHQNGNYTDGYGTEHNDEAAARYEYTLKLPSRFISLTEQDCIDFGISKELAGTQVGSASYYLAKGSSVKAYLNYRSLLVGQENSYVQSVALDYPGQDYVFQDGAERPGTNTRKEPVGVEERIISQQIKVTKTIDEKSYRNTNSYSEVHEDWWSRLFGNHEGNGASDHSAKKLDNFRFKTYLKSNLEALYRNENGEIVWQDRMGTDRTDAEQLAANKAFPMLVNKIYTKVPHQTDPLFKKSNDAAIANTALYDYHNGLISDEANTGYTRLLETADYLVEDGDSTRTVKNYNYEKFFDAISVSNGDKWDENHPTYTSYKPIGNLMNRTEEQLDNARVSDRVRQFAISWYLDNEVKKLVQEVDAGTGEKEASAGATAYSEETYDLALRQAIIKAENYLKPFFAYDLDELYAIHWDSEANGGNDHDTTTLAANTIYGDKDLSKDGGYAYGLSKYLPYGTYVVAEQPPHVDELKDFKNRHYQIDQPREVTLPSVYASYDASQETPETLNSFYNYDCSDSMQQLEQKYQIRFGEEDHKIQAHNHHGDFEVYKYGLDLNEITNGVLAEAGNYFALTQSPWRPLKNYYNPENDRSAAEVTYYLTEGQSGRKGISENYRYSSLSEDAGLSDDVPYPGADITADNRLGIQYRDHVATMTGMQTAYEGKYAAMLVPYSVIASTDEQAEVTDEEPGQGGSASYRGFAYDKFVNRFFTAKLRIEKIDSETHENILHDGALFNLYAASRDDIESGQGTVKFTTEPTQFTGTKEFLTAMGATDIRPIAKGRLARWIDRITGKENGIGDLYSGTVPEGTPICSEDEQIVLGDEYGNKTVAFKTYSTTRDGLMRDEMTDQGASYQDQNVGYLELPQPLGAGVYVLAEVDPPAGYARSKPIAIEVYSDKITYYKEGTKDSRVLAVVYEDDADHQTTNANKPEDKVNVAQVYVENTPIRLEVEKVKESYVGKANTTADKTVSYKISGRVDGKYSEIGKNPDLVYAYRDGKYLGYAWQKGTLEYLEERKAAGEKVEIVYSHGTFAGYGYVTRTLETADDENGYVAGALMTLFDAIPVERSGFEGDEAYNGLKIERNLTNNITRMYIEQGYAGEKVEFVREKDEAGKELEVTFSAGIDKDGNTISVTGGVWSAVTLQRPDTDILYYDLDGLDPYQERYIDGQFITYVYDKTHKQTPVEDAERDRRNFEKTDIEHSMYVFKDGVPYLEITEGDFTKVKYRKNDKQLEVEAGTKIYHLDKDGYRDALVDPATGMAYIEEGCSDGTVRTLVWPVNVRKDEFGNVIARDKITTSRIATVAENKDGYADDETLDVVNNSTAEIPDADKPSYTHAESGHITGTWKGNGEQSHEESSVEQNRFNQDMNGSVLVDDNDGDFLNELNPVYDDHGLVLYYQRSSETYKKGEDLYDRNGDFVRHQDSDNLEEYNLNAYRINEHDELYDASQEKKTPERKNLYHRLGEGYILENTWLSSDKTPNDPFDTFQTDGQADVLKRLPSGTYILEELKAPEGYVKGLPSGISVAETGELQHVQMVDRTTKIEISKIHAPQDTKMPVLDMDHEHPETGEKPYEREVVTGDIASYTYSSVSGAKLALYPARRVYSADTEKYPKGYYLVKTQNTPLVWEDTNSTASNPVWNTAEWISGNEPAYFERIPAGDYLLEEIETPEGFVTADPVEITVGDQSEVETVCMKNDTTKVEIEKFFTDEHGEKVQLSGAEFSLHQAVVNAEGEIIYDADGTPVYDARVLASFKSGTVEDYQNFRDAFEKAYASYGVDLSLFGWKENGQEKSATVTAKTVMDATSAGGSHDRFATKALLTMITSDGETIRVAVSGNLPETVFDYQFDYQKLEHINAYADTYLTDRGTRRINGLPAGEKYVLVETKAPDGFLKADAQVIVVENRKEIQQYHIEDLEGQIWLSKSAVGVTGEMAGATMALYRADQSGNLNQSDEYLVSQWVTGADGIYTVTDKVNGRIPEGYQVGDLRIHIETGLAEGIYYLVELSAPDYYTLAEPARFEYHLDDLVQTIRAVNEAVKGALSITKTGEDGQGLAGATFEIKAYKENDLDEPVTTNMIYGTEPVITVQDLPVGEMRPDGSIIPYTYTLQEIAAPEGYSVNPEIITWQFEPKQGDGQSFAHETVVIHQESVKDQKTRLYFSKQDFDVLGDDNTEGAFIDGAILSIYEVTGKDEHDQPVYDKDAPFTTWTTRKLEKRHKVIGLIAGHTYILVEDTAPKGWNLMKPVLFTVSSDGRSIQGLSNQMESIEIQRVSKNDYELDTINRDTTSIEQVKLKGRYVTQIYYELTDANKDLIESWIGAGEEHVIRKPFASVSEGSAYTITEYCRYSDGTVLVTDRFTKTFWFDENGEIKIPTREIDHVNETLSYADGTKITAFIPDADNQEKQVKNPLQKDDLVITRLSADGASALAPDQAIFERIRMINTDHKTADMVLTVTVDADTSIIDPGTGTFDGEKLVFHFESVAPGEAAYAAFTTQVSGEASTIEAKAEYNGIVRETQKTVPVLTYGKVVLFNELTGSGKERYKDQKTSFRVKLYDASTGRELPGTYSYSGSRTGMIKSGDTISLSGNEYVKIDPGYYKNVTYEIEKIENGLHHTEKMTSGSVDVTHGNGARFTRNIEDTAKRTIFKQGETYVLTEETVFANGDSLPTNKISTILGQSVNVEGIAAADRKTKVMISKTEIGGGKELAGCEMELYDEENNLIHRWTSSDVAESLEEFLEPGKTYRLVEKSPEPGYSYAEDITFTVNEDGTVDRVVMVDKPTHIVLSKKKITNSEELPGALLQVVDKDGNVVEEWISTDKPHEIVAKLVVDESYVLREVRPADGWAYAEDVPFKVSHDGTVDYVKMEDKPTHVVISKQEITGSKELPGCTLQVIDKNGNVVDEWFSTDQPHEIKEKLIADEEYTLREVRPADGWAYAEDIPFKVSHDGTVDQVKMEDKPTHVVVSKKKITGKEELPGCHLVIKDKNGNVVDEWTSSTIPHEIVAKLIAGETYTLIEIRPADGYSVAESIEFTVSKDGSVDMVEMFDDVTHVEFGKVNPNGTLLSGGQIQIKDLDGNVLVDFVPDGTVYRVDGVLKAGETYVIHEVSAPGGYRVSEDQEFIMPLGQETKEIRFVNFAINGGGGGGGTTPGKRQLSIRKYDPVNQIGVAGAKLTVYSAGGSLYLKGITDESGYLTFAMPADGTYTYQETEAPAGYYLNPAVQYLYIKDGKVTNPENRTLYDYPNVEVILEKKDSEDGTAVPDTLLQVTDPAGQVVFHGRTDEAGACKVPACKAGTYRIVEIEPANGYERSEAPWQFLVSYDGTIAGETTLYNEKIDKRVGIGRIYAHYESTNGSSGSYGLGVPDWLKQPKAGDTTDSFKWYVLATIFAMGAGGLVLIGRRKGKKKDDEA